MWTDRRRGRCADARHTMARTTTTTTTTFDATSARDGFALNGARKLAFVSELFDRVAPRYDVVNGAIALGFCGRWRRRALTSGLRWATANEPRTFKRGDVALDVGCGSGAVTATVMYGELSFLGVEVIGMDCSEGMLREARERTPGAARFERGNAAAMTYANGEFDVVTTVYTLRNFPDLRDALSEMLRVTKPGGRVMILDAFPPSGALGFALRWWLNFMLPLLGWLMTGDAKPYTYLANSIQSTATPREVKAMLEELGADRVEVTSYWPFGAAAKIMAYKDA